MATQSTRRATNLSKAKPTIRSTSQSRAKAKETEAASNGVTKTVAKPSSSSTLSKANSKGTKVSVKKSSTSKTDSNGAITQATTAKREGSALRKVNYRTFKKDKPDVLGTGGTSSNGSSSGSSNSTSKATGAKTTKPVPELSSSNKVVKPASARRQSTKPDGEPKGKYDLPGSPIKSPIRPLPSKGSSKLDDDEPIVLDEADIMYFNEGEEQLNQMPDYGFVEDIIDDPDELANQSGLKTPIKPTPVKPAYEDRIPPPPAKSLAYADQLYADNDDYLNYVYKDDIGEANHASSGFESYQEQPGSNEEIEPEQMYLPLAERITQNTIDGLDTIKSQTMAQNEDDLIDLHTDMGSTLDIFTRLFGRKHVVASVQTHDRSDSEQQTDSFQVFERAVQHPHFRTGLLADLDDNFDKGSLSFSDPFQLSNFLARAEKIIDLIVDPVDLASSPFERNSAKCSRRMLKVPTDCEAYCSQLYKLVSSPLARHAPVMQVTCNAQYIMSTQIIEDSEHEQSLVVAWPLDQEQQVKPEHLLIARSAIGCLSSDEQGRMFAGMNDGSLAVWDICEPPHQHRCITIDSVPFTLRSPSYSTACLANSDGHKNPIVSVHVLPANEGSSTDTCSLVSVDAAGIVIVWELRKIYKNQELSLATDEGEGMMPGSSIRLHKKSTFSSPLITQSKANPKGSQLVNCTAVSSQFPDHVYLGTNEGQVIRAARYTDDSLLPVIYKCPFVDYISPVASIAFNPCTSASFLVGYEDGTLALFSVQDFEPEQLWEPSDTSITELVAVRWHPKRTSVFIVMDNSSSVYLWDLSANNSEPIITLPLRKLTSIEFLSNGNLSAIIGGTEDGSLEILVLNERLGREARDRRLSTLMGLFAKPTDSAAQN